MTVNGIKYFYTSNVMSFKLAKSTCHSREMRVFEPRDAVVYNEVLDKMNIQEDIWINIYKETSKKG